MRLPAAGSVGNAASTSNLPLLFESKSPNDCCKFIVVAVGTGVAVSGTFVCVGNVVGVGGSGVAVGGTRVAVGALGAVVGAAVGALEPPHAASKKIRARKKIEKTILFMLACSIILVLSFVFAVTV